MANPFLADRQEPAQYAGPPTDWRATAKTDPKIRAWYDELRAKYPSEPENIVEHMERSMTDPRGFNYKTAIENGLRPGFDAESGELHWMGDVPETGQILKGPEHPTRHKSERPSGQPQTYPNNPFLSDTQTQAHPGNPFLADVKQPEEEPSSLDLLGRGVMHGLTGMGESVGTGLEWAGAEELGGKVEDYFRQRREGAYAPPESIQGSILEKPELLADLDWWAFNVGSIAPTLAASIIPGTLAAKAVHVAKLPGVLKGATLAKEGQKAIQIGGKTYEHTSELASKLKRLGQISRITGLTVGGTTGGALEGTQTYREVYDKALARGATEDEARAAANSAGLQMTAASGILNAYSVDRWLKALPDDMKGRAAARLMRGLTEGITEWLEGPAEAGIMLAGEMVTPEEAFQKTLDELNVLPPAFVMGLIMPGAGTIPSMGEPAPSILQPPGETLGDLAGQPPPSAPPAAPAPAPQAEPQQPMAEKVQQKLEEAQKAAAPAAQTTVAGPSVQAHMGGMGQPITPAGPPLTGRGAPYAAPTASPAGPAPPPTGIPYAPVPPVPPDWTVGGEEVGPTQTTPLPPQPMVPRETMAPVTTPGIPVEPADRFAPEAPEAAPVTVPGTQFPERQAKAKSNYAKRRVIHPEKDDLLTAIGKAGGISKAEAAAEFGLEPDGAELKNKGGMFPVWRKSPQGLSFDEMAEALSQSGQQYLSAENLKAELHDKLWRAMGGERIMAPSGVEQQGEALATEEQERRQWAEDFSNPDNFEPDAYEGESQSTRTLADLAAHAVANGMSEDTVEVILERGVLQGLSDEALATQLREAADQPRQGGAGPVQEVAPAEPTPEEAEPVGRGPGPAPEGRTTLELTGGAVPAPAPTTPAPSQAGLFPPATTREEVAAVGRAKDEELRGAGAPEAEGPGELFESTRGKQVEIEEAQALEHEKTTPGLEFGPFPDPKNAGQARSQRAWVGQRLQASERLAGTRWPQVEDATSEERQAAAKRVKVLKAEDQSLRDLTRYFEQEEVAPTPEVPTKPQEAPASVVAPEPSPTEPAPPKIEDVGEKVAEPLDMAAILAAKQPFRAYIEAEGYTWPVKPNSPDFKRLRAEFAELKKGGEVAAEKDAAPAVDQAPERSKETVPSETIEDEIRRDLGVANKTALDAYDPAMAIDKVRRQWQYQTLQGNYSPEYFKTKREAIAAAGRHIELKREQYAKPSLFRDISVVRATKRLALIEKYMGQGLSEMKAGERARAEIPDAPVKPEPAPAKIEDVGEKVAAPAESTEPVAQELPKKAPSLPSIPYSAAFDAHRGSSMVPEKRANQRQDEFRDTLQSDWETLRKLPRNQAERDVLMEEWPTYAAGYRQNYMAGLSADSRTMSSMITGPANFPTARNQKRLDTARKRWDEASDYRERALKAIRKKIRPETAAISSDDADATTKLRAKIAKLEADQAKMREINKAVRKKDDTRLKELGLGEKTIASLYEPDFGGRVGIPGYELTNNSANIRRLKKRLAELERTAADETTEVEFDGGRIVDNVDDNRLQIFFDEKPSAEVRDQLKSRGFHWSRKLGAWQRMRSNAATYAAEEITGAKLPAVGAKEPPKFSRHGSPQPAAKGATVAQVRAWIRPITLTWADGTKPDIRVVQSFSDLPQAVQDAAGGPVDGVYDEGTVYLVADMIPTPQAAKTVLAHESISHHSMEQIVKNWPAVVEQIQNLTKTDKRVGALAEQVTTRYGRLDPTTYAKEILGVAGEKQYTQGTIKAILQRVRAAIRAFLKKIGLGGLWQAGEIDLLLVRAGDNLLTRGVRTRSLAAEPKSTEQSTDARVMDAEPLFSRRSETPEHERTDLDQTQKDALGKIAPETEPKTLRQRIGEIQDNWSNRFVQKVADQYRPIRNVLKDPESWKRARMSASAPAALEAAWLNGEISLDENGAIVLDQERQGLADVLAELDGEHQYFMAWVAGNRAHAIKQRSVANAAQAERLREQAKAKIGEAAEIRERKSSDRTEKRRMMKLTREAKTLRQEALTLKRASKVTERLFSDEQIAALRRLDQGTMSGGRNRAEVYAETWRKFDHLQNQILDIAEQSGLVSAEEREQWAGEFYVPFYRYLDSDGHGAENIKSLQSGGRSIANQTAYKKLKGADIPLNDLLANTLLNWGHLLSASLKNNAAVGAIDSAVELGIAEAIPEAEMARAFKGGGKPPKNAIFVRRDGEATWYEIADPMVMEALDSLHNSPFSSPGIKEAVDTLSWFKRALTFGVTQSPLFWARNTFRDTITTMAVSEASPNGFKNFAQGTRSVLDKTLRAQLTASGAEIAFGHLYSADVDAQERALRKRIRATDITHNPSAAKRLTGLLRGVGRAWAEAGSAAENINRAALYKQLLERGYSHFEASFQARDLLDFSSMGSSALIRFAARTVPFLNARIQGLDRMTRSNRKRFFSVLSGYIVAAVGLYLMYRDDEDFKEREDWDRDNYLYAKVGGHEFRLPKPFEIGVIGTIAERATEQMLDELQDRDEVAAGKFVESLKHAITDTFAINPMGVQFFKPAFEVWGNTNTFTGRNIESMAMERRTKPERYRAYTSEIAKGASKGMYTVSKGLRDVGLTINANSTTLSPVQIEHLIRGYFGWVGTMALTVADEPLKMAGPARPPRTLEDYTGGMVRDTELSKRHSRYATEFYRQLRLVREINSDISWLRRLGKYGEARERRGSEMPTLKSRQLMESTYRRAHRLNQRMLKVIMDDTMSSEKKTEEMDRLRGLKNETYKRTMTLLREREKAAAAP